MGLLVKCMALKMFTTVYHSNAVKVSPKDSRLEYWLAVKWVNHFEETAKFEVLCPSRCCTMKSSLLKDDRC